VEVLRRHGISTRAKRLSLIAGYRSPYEPPSEPQPEPHIDVERPGELVGVDCFYIGRLHGTNGAIWQLTAIDCYSSYGWAELVRCPDGKVNQAQTSRLVQRVARELRRAGWKLERVLTDNGNEFQTPTFTDTLRALNANHSRIHAGRPQTNGHVERLHRTILEECWRPAFARDLYLRYRGLQRELLNYLNYYNHQRAHTGRITLGAVPADLVYGAHKTEPK
jgi:transposase InsO family protein